MVAIFIFKVTYESHLISMKEKHGNSVYNLNLNDHIW